MMDPRGAGRSSREATQGVSERPASLSEGLLQGSVGRKVAQFSALRFQVFIQCPDCLKYLAGGTLQDVPSVAGLMPVDIVHVFALMLDDAGGAAFHTIPVPRALPLGDRFKFTESEG